MYSKPTYEALRPEALGCEVSCGLDAALVEMVDDTSLPEDMAKWPSGLRR